MERLVDRQAGLGQQPGTVVLAGHRFLILLLVELEEVGLAGSREKAVEGVEAVDVDIDADALGHKAELCTQQIADEPLCRREVANLGQGAGAGSDREGGE